MNNFEKPSPYSAEAQQEAAENYQFTGNPATSPSMRELLAAPGVGPRTMLAGEVTLAATRRRVLELIREHRTAAMSCDWDTFTTAAIVGLLGDLSDDVAKITTLEI
jgi:hypothetical protein